ncbi:sulfatase-like hydrolase/transferase [Hymenobacter glacialis]|uniref:Sulfatase n=1 Tax=Hymenobacter glacialis TaxID=1908236 RepID=A0A1G1TCG6_9BACT|nr:sulfatase-like hydrolase/transferase [Hymenobacter glacialis]OGX88528.1 sulfatase [Hymenobacter glacialis]
MAFLATSGQWSCRATSSRWLRRGLGLGLLGLMAFAPPPAKKPLRTKNIIIVVIDGPRYSETWGTVPGLIPNMATTLRPRGVFFSNFYNKGFTYTNSGHVALTTGISQPIDNFDQELPQLPSFFQLWRKATGAPATAAWVISSKDKLHILANTLHPEWKDQYQPSVDCGVSGPGTGYRADSLTLEAAKRILTQHKPRLVLINFMEPDGFAHAANYPFYLRGIARDDRYVMQLYNFLRTNSAYKNNTTLFITNDHGRHLDSIDGGYIDHGDGCDGCRHVSLLALGPDFKIGRTVADTCTLLDVPSTAAYLLGLPFGQGQGKVLEPMLKRR